MTLRPERLIYTTDNCLDALIRGQRIAQLRTPRVVELSSMGVLAQFT